MTGTRVFDDRICTLGEGPLWHPLRGQLYWFDITGRRLLTRRGDAVQEWSFDETVSAAGWVDPDSLMMASASGLWHVSLVDGSRKRVCPLEEDNAATRSNDGRADPWGGFWIGTMGYEAQTGAGAIYRFYRGQLRRLYGQISIPNAICFAPDRNRAYFTDTPTRKVMQVALDSDGWPAGDPGVFVDLNRDGLNPDGALTDRDGVVWIAQWGAARVAAYAPDGTFVRAVELPAQHVTCPAFGGENLGTLHVTSATQDIPADLLKKAPRQGQTFAIDGLATGLPEPQVLL